MKSKRPSKKCSLKLAACKESDKKSNTKQINDQICIKMADYMIF